MSQIPQSSVGMRPHRGVLVLVLGILGIVLCFICGIVAWIMGNGDLRQMDAGLMDPTGRGLTQAGKICGIIAVALAAIGLVIWGIIMILAVIGAAAGARPGAPDPRRRARDGVFMIRVRLERVERTAAASRGGVLFALWLLAAIAAAMLVSRGQADPASFPSRACSSG